jgi:O-acetyl-ADP-ribose deacetylase (regulator of RNase III)
MKTIKGNLLGLAKQGQFDVIIHGCNCFNAMGAGIADQIAREFPEAYQADCKTVKGDRAKLGNYTFAVIRRGDVEFTIINAYTQYAYGRGQIHADSEAIRAVMKKIRHDFAGKRIGYPMIGAGYARGDWKEISGIIENELAGEDHTFVQFVP